MITKYIVNNYYGFPDPMAATKKFEHQYTMEELEEGDIFYYEGDCMREQYQFTFLVNRPNYWVPAIRKRPDGEWQKLELTPPALTPVIIFLRKTGTK